MKTKADEAELRNIILTWYTFEPMKPVSAHPVSQALYDPGFNAWVEDILKSAPGHNAPAPKEPDT
ncbi:MAG: hypothetical protein AAFO77_09020 [Pseudomonadota bacterium]